MRFDRLKVSFIGTLFIFLIAANAALSLLVSAAATPRIPNPNDLLDPCSNYLQIVSPREGWTRDSLKREYVHWTPVASSENQDFIDLGFQAENPGSLPIIFFDIELAVLKALNDKNSDKDLVTALFNLHKDIFFSLAKKIATQHPHLKFARYSDEKLSSLAISGENIHDFYPVLQQLFEDTISAFSKTVTDNNLLRATDPQPQTWYHAGVGSTPDQANLAARYSRQKQGLRKVWDFRSPEVQRDLATTLDWIELNRRELEEKLGQGTLWNGWVLSVDLATAIRKTETFADLQKELKRLQPSLAEKPEKEFAELTQSTLDYVQAVDEFSPSIRKVEKTVASLGNADWGGLSLDLVGFGGLNLRATASALHQSRSVQEALRYTRTAEQWSTKRLKGELQIIQTAVRTVLMRHGYELESMEIRSSGDDVVIRFLDSGHSSLVPELIAQIASASSYPHFATIDPQSIELLRILNENPQPSTKRVAEIPVGVPPLERAELAVHGELLEKALRQILKGSIDSRILKQLLFAVRMPQTKSAGHVRLLVGSGNGPSLTPIDLSLLGKAFAEATDEFNRKSQTAYTLPLMPLQFAILPK